jgi:uroporphyrinogen decarboxylase
MLDALRIVRRELNGRVPLIGFAGAPWTLAAYMVEGKGTKQFAVAKKMLFEQPALAHALLDKLATPWAISASRRSRPVRRWCSCSNRGPARSARRVPQFSLPYLAKAAKMAR